MPTELHVFQNGKHGVGMAQTLDGTKEWPQLCHNWLEVQGILDPAKKPKE